VVNVTGSSTMPRQAEAGVKGISFRTTAGEARGAVRLRRERVLRRVQRLPHAQRGQDLALRHQDLGKTWTDISGGMNNPCSTSKRTGKRERSLLGTDYGVFVTIDQGKSWTAFSKDAPDVSIRDLAIQKRTGRWRSALRTGFYVVDIGPIKEFTPAVFDEAAHLFDPKTVVKWNRYQRRGEQTASTPRR